MKIKLKQFIIKIEKELKTMFKKGDKVKIRGGRFKGEIGEVITSYNLFDKIEGDDVFSVAGDKFDIRQFFGENLELLSTEDTQLQNNLNHYLTDGNLDNLFKDKPDLLKPNHYQGKNGDLFDEWYERYPFDVFRIVLLSTAERYFRRYHLKDGLDGLKKGIEVMQRLREYELKEQNNE